MINNDPSHLQHLDKILNNIEVEMSSLNVNQSPFESAYVLTGLYYAYLKMNNVDIESHPIKQQLSRLKSVHHKIEENKKEINTEVITRVVQHHLGIKKQKQDN